eukprot:Skav201985  [mRNA]  locus=scaffold2976:97130:99642:+ [translate_table: standard]
MGAGEPHDLPRPLHDDAAPGTHQPLEAALFQYACWNIQGKHLTQCIDVLLSSDLDFHLLALQEATLPAGECTQTEDDDYRGLPGVWFYEGYTIVHAKPPGCFRRLALCLETELLTKWSTAKVGHSHLQAQIWFSFLPDPVTVVVAHLPHSGRPLEEFQLACVDLQRCLHQCAARRSPVLLLGDLNEQIHRHGHLGDRLTDLDLLHYSLDGVSTWRDRRPDHVVYSSAFIDLSQTIGPPHCPWANLTALVYKHLHHAAQSPGSVYASLKSIVPTCSRPLASRRYVDPPSIKDLCRRRSLCVCPVERKHFNFQIYRLRAEARKRWRQTLIHDAAMGDWSSKKLLQHRRPLPVALRPLLDKHHGDHSSAASDVQRHFESKFSPSGAGSADADALLDGPLAAVMRRFASRTSVSTSLRNGWWESTNSRQRSISISVSGRPAFEAASS